MLLANGKKVLIKKISIATNKLTFHEYSEMVANISLPSIYHKPDWIKLLLQNFDGEFLALISRNVDKQSILAITPFICIKKLGLKFFGSPLSGTYTEYCGPIIYGTSICEADLVEVLKSQHLYLLNNFQPKYIEWGGTLEPYYPGSGLDSLKIFGYEKILRPTLQLDLAGGEEDVWMKFQGRARTAIKKANRENLCVTYENLSESGVCEYYDLLRQSFLRQGAKKPSHPIDFFQSLRNLALGESSEIQFCMARKSGKLVSGAIFLHMNKRVVYLSGASSKEGLKTGAASLIQWTHIKESISSGYLIYDFCGVGIASIDKFKMSFGGILRSHHRWIYRPLYLKILERCYRYLRSKGIV